MLPAEAGTARTLVAGTEGDIVMPASPPPPPDLACRDASRPRVCEAALRSNCTDAATRSGCAKTCGLCTALVVPVQVATLIDGRLPIPVGADKVFLEVGSSDRNTLDTELLPAHPDGFLVTCEPLLDKYARALSRRAPQSEVFDLVDFNGDPRHALTVYRKLDLDREQAGRPQAFPTVPRVPQSRSAVEQEFLAPGGPPTEINGTTLMNKKL